jgi:hypothetical protein
MPASINSAISSCKPHATQNGITPEHAGALKPRSRVQSLRSLVLVIIRVKPCTRQPFTVLFNITLRTPASDKYGSGASEFLVSGHTVSASYQEGCEPRGLLFACLNGMARDSEPTLTGF